MTKLNGSAVPGPAARYQSPATGPAGPAADDGKSVSLHSMDSPLPNGGGSRSVDRTDNSEQALLLRAFTRANDELSRAQESFGAAGAAVVGTFQQALAAIAATERFVNGDAAAYAVREVVTVRRRHEDDGPESLRRTPWVWRVLAGVTLLGSAAFDTVFVGMLLQRFFGVGRQSLGYWLAYLPGAGQAICLFGVGTLLAAPFHRWRTRADRRRERTRRGLRGTLRHLAHGREPWTEQRAADDLPWPNAAGPVLFALLVFAVVGFWARERAQYAVHEYAADLVRFENLVVVLMVMLSVATVLTAMLAHNPYADSARHGRWAVRFADGQLRWGVKQARKRLVAHTAAWNRLHSAVDRAEARAHGRLEDAYARIIEQRAGSGTAGSIDLPLPEPVWPWPPARRTPDGTPPRLPALRTDLLQPTRDLLTRSAPPLLERSLATLTTRATHQFTPPEPAEGDDG